MSQFTLTPEEDAIITDALRAKATQYTAMFGVSDPALEALIAKLDSYNPVVVEEAPAAKPKKVKAVQEAETVAAEAPLAE
jgi:hypothetical protein